MCFCVAALAAAWVLAGNEADSPYVTTEMFQQVYFTDEGLYTKGAIWFARHRELVQPFDFSATYLTTPFYLVLLGYVFNLFGESWQVARAFSIFLTLLSLGAFWSICRAAMPRAYCWLATVSVALTFQYLHSARLATADPPGLAFCLLSAAVWIHWRRSAAGTAAALVLALAAVFLKAGYLAFLGAIGLSIAVDALLDWREGRRGRAVAAVLLLGLAAGTLFGIRASLRMANPALSEYLMRLNLYGDMGLRISIGTGIRYQLRSFLLSAPLLPGVPVLLAAGLVALLAGWGEARERLAARLRSAAMDPMTRLMALWALGGTVLFGLTGLQGARYYLFLAPVTAYLAFWSLHRFIREERWALRVALLVAVLHLAGQSNLYLLWAQQAPEATYISICRSMAGKIMDDNGGRPAAVLGHGISDWLALFDSRITGVDYGYNGMDKVIPRRERFLHWRPKYVVINEDDVWLNSASLDKLLRANPDVFAGAEPMAEYRFLFRNSYPNSPANRAPNLKLLRLRYRDEGGGA
jgi:4-amino-4-deoxy-L-arabinose transferase-like glycosyltransferase